MNSYLTADTQWDAFESFGTAPQALTHSSTEDSVFCIMTGSHALFKMKAVIHNQLLLRTPM